MGLVLRVVFVVGLLTGSADNPDIKLDFFYIPYTNLSSLFLNIQHFG